MNLDGTEKEKRKISPKKRIWRFFIRLVLFIVLLPALYLGVRYIFNYSMYWIHLQQWNEQGFATKIEISYQDCIHADSNHGIMCGPPWPTTIESAFWFASDCIKSIFCSIQYDERYGYPREIHNVDTFIAFSSLNKEDLSNLEN